jgi:tartrate-resistant acid phosphatase type 5
MRRAPAIVLALSLLLAGCASIGIDEATKRVGAPFPRSPPREDVSFLAFGDYGFGNEAQNRTARGMERVCEAEGCDIALALGDHYYPQPPEDAKDPALRRVLLDPYRNLSIPFYAVLGNHDAHAADGAPLLAFANASRDAWRMADRSYAFREGDVLFVAIDMTSYAGDEEAGENASRALAWLDDITASEDYRTARWRVAFAHFPYASNGVHGSAGRYDHQNGSGAAVARLIERGVCGKFDAYLAGHDHDLEWIAPRASCAGTELIVSGAGAEARKLGHKIPTRFQHDASPGFFWFDAQRDALLVRAYDGDGALLYERPIKAAE